MKEVNSYLSKAYLIIAICFLIVVFSGCSKKEAVIPKDSIPSNSPLLTSDEPQTEDVFKDFKTLIECFMEIEFEVKINGTTMEPVSFLVNGKYDLNHDGTSDEISIWLKGPAFNDNMDSYVKVNEAISNLPVEYSVHGEVRLVDLDKDDQFIEIACFDQGPSEDPQYHFYRYDGSSLFYLGSIDAACDIDEYGKVISSFFKARLNPSFYSAWYEVENNRFEVKNNDIKQYLGKTYSIEGMAYFSPAETMTYEIEWNNPRIFRGELISLIDIGITEENRILNNYFVEFSSGEKGMLNFWIGD